MLVTRLTQPGGKVHQAGDDQTPGGVDHARRGEARRNAPHTDDPSRSQRYVTLLIKATGRVDHAAVLDENLHDLKQNWPLTLIP